MADNIIDELQLKVGANASEAINNLGRLQHALRSLAKDLGTVSAAANSLTKISASLGRLGSFNTAKLENAFRVLERLQKIDLQNLDGKRINIDVQLSGADAAERKMYALQDAAKRVDVSMLSKKFNEALGLKGVDASRVSRAFVSAIEDMAKGGDGSSAFTGWIKNIQANGLTLARTSFREDLAVMRDEYKRFLDDLNKHKIKLTEGVDKKNLFENTSAYERMQFFSKEGTALDGRWNDIIHRFPSIMAGMRGVVNEEEQVYAILERIREGMEATGKVNLSNLKGDDSDSAWMSILTNITNAREGLEQAFNKEFTQAMKESATKIPLDVSVDPTRIEAQIDAAVKQAASKKYELPVNFSIDTKGMKTTISTALGEIDVSSMGELQEHLKGASESLATIGTINAKDTGVTAFVNSLRRLTEVDLSKFNTGVLNEIIGTINTVSQMGDISGSINRLVSSLARLANAGEKTGQSATALPRLNSALREVITGISSAGGIPAELNAFVGAIAQLANAGNRTGATATQLESLGTAIRDFMASLQNAPEVSQNVVQIVQATAQLASSGAKAGSAAKGIGKSISSIGSGDATARIRAIVGVLGELVKICEKAGGIVKSAVSKIISGLKSLKTPGNGIKGITENIKSMIAAMIGFRGITGLASFVKETVQMGAALTEIDHIVESVFGNLSGYVDEWAKSAITNFGIAEQSAKQYAGVLSSMFQASGIGYQDAGKMGMDLVELAGDLSAFYNIDTETAYNKIRSGMAGMVRPLRDLGIDLTAATLEEFRLAQGIETSYKSMSQAEKVMLRYRYLMANTTTQQGDFALGMIA